MLSLDSLRRLERAGVTLLERGWLSSNNVLIQGQNGPTALVDSGYCTHSMQTLELVALALGDRPLDMLLNTHLHSDHCGGNAALQARYPRMQTLIPPGQAPAVKDWDEVSLTYSATGQQCPRFGFEGLLQPGHSVFLGDWLWEIHGASGHDPHSIVLYQQEHRILLSADALWENGFGVVFPELEGLAAFEEVGQTLTLIESLSPAVVVPGHGPAFSEIENALERARSRLRRFQEHPRQHLRHAYKVLIKFKLLEWQHILRAELSTWVEGTPYLSQAIPANARETWLNGLLDELERSHALRVEGDFIVNT